MNRFNEHANRKDTNMDIKFAKRSQGDNTNATMVVMVDGKLVGWGNNNTGVLANGLNGVTTSAPAQEVLFDPNTTLPAFDAEIVDWAFTNANLYVVFNNGSVYSAGGNDYGQLGHGDSVDRPYLKRIDALWNAGILIDRVWAGGIAQLTLGGGSAYFRPYSGTTNKLYACGHNLNGSLGLNNIVNQSTPQACVFLGTALTASQIVQDVQLASAYTSGLSAYVLFNETATPSGNLFVAGVNTSGQLALNTTTDQETGFTRALTAVSTPILSVLTVSATGGYTGAAVVGSALVTTSNTVYTVGYNGYGQLGLGNTTTPIKLFTAVTFPAGSLPTFPVTAKIGGGFTGMAYAVDSSAPAKLHTWGFNSASNLFLGGTAHQTSPQLVSLSGISISKVFLQKSDANTATLAQMLALTTDNKLIYAGADNGQKPITPVSGAPFKYIALPKLDNDPSHLETISNVFVHGSGSNQRLFIRTEKDGAFCRFLVAGGNADSVCTAGFSSNSMAASVDGFEIALPQ
jgi:alpha-tubulin suppressor-like RCC1 family protein